MSSAPVPGPFRPPMGVPGTPRPAPPPAVGRPVEPGEGPGSGHPAVDAIIQSIANAAGLPPADQIAQYEAAHRALQEILATIDQT
jgi:hypothetical protein